MVHVTLDRKAGTLALAVDDKQSVNRQSGVYQLLSSTAMARDYRGTPVYRGTEGPHEGRPQ